MDGHSGVRALTNGSGAISESYNYTAFGSLLNGPTNPATSYLYTGQQFDSLTQLYDLRARYYNSTEGRFLSRDHFVTSLNHPIELNRYNYVASNPATFKDPSGSNLVEDKLTYNAAAARPEQKVSLIRIGVSIFFMIAALGVFTYGGISASKENVDQNCKKHIPGQSIDPRTFCLALGRSDRLGVFSLTHPTLSTYWDVYGHLPDADYDFILKILVLMFLARQIHFNMSGLDPAEATAEVEIDSNWGIQPKPDLNTGRGNYTNYELCMVARYYHYKTIPHNESSMIGNPPPFQRTAKCP